MFDSSLSPEIENIPDGWTIVDQGEAPWMNGGVLGIASQS